MSDKKGPPRKLGRGLEALFGDERTNLVTGGSIGNTISGKPEGMRVISVAKLSPNPLQPRRNFDEAALRDLTNSIQEKGVLQPLIVRPCSENNGTFEIVAGERRWRAAQRAQVHEVPVVVRNFTEEEAFAVALIENIQRDELSPLEEAKAFSRLAKDFKKTQEQVAAAVGKSRSHVANMLRLLDLPEDVREMLSAGDLSAGHARAILGAPNPTALAGEIVSKGLTVREAERLAKVSRERAGRTRISGNRSTPGRKDADTIALERKLSMGLGSKVEISFDGTGGYVSVQYRSLEQFEDLVERLMGKNPKSLV